MIYHTNVYMPNAIANLVPQGYALRVQYSYHATEQAWVKYQIRDGHLPPFVQVKRENIIEVETTEDGSLNKFVARFAYTPTDDMVMAIIPKGRGWFVKTIWLNRRSDKHNTLKRHLYVQPAA